jgi:hypothetical protein
MAAIPLAMAAGGSVLGASKENKAIAASNDALRKQAIEQTKQMNYTDANLKMQQQETREDYQNQQTDNNMQMVRNLGTLRAAIGESGLEGNSMRRISMVTQGDYIRQSAGLNDNYQRDYAKIFGDRVTNVESSKRTIENILSQEKKQKSTGKILLDATMSAGQSFMGGQLTGGAGGAAGSSGALSGILGSLFNKSNGATAPISAAVGTKTK